MHNLNETYPNLTRWQAGLANNASGFLIFFTGVAVLALGVAWLIRSWRETPTTFMLDIRYTLVLGVLLRLPLLRESFWYDESFTAGLARLPFPQMLTVIRSDVHPPLWYTLEWLIGRFSTSELALRLISLLAGLVAIVLVQRVVTRLYDSQTGSMAALLTAALPTMIYYSTEARPYMLIVCCVLGLLLCIMDDRPRRFALIAALLLLLHNIAYIYVALLGIAAFWQWRHRGWIYAGVPVVIVGVLWLPMMLLQMGDIADGFWLQFYPGMVAHTTVNMTLGWRIGENALLPVAGGWIACLVVCLVLYRPRAWQWLWAVAAFGVPGVVGFISAVWKPVYLDRAMLSAALMMSVPIAHGMVRRFGIRLVVQVVITISAIGMFNETRTPFRDYVQQCAGDSLFVTSTAVAFLVDYYREDRLLYVWSGSNDLNQSLPDEAKDALGWARRDDVPEGTVCLLWYDTQLSSAAEMRYVNRLTGFSSPLVISARRHLANNTLGDLYALEMINEHK